MFKFKNRDKAISRWLLIAIYGAPGLTLILSVLKTIEVFSFGWAVAFLPVILVGSFLVLIFLAIATLIMMEQLK